MSRHFPVSDVIKSVQAKFVDCGLAQHLAAGVTDVLVRADMMGHHTHGLSLMPHYLGEIQRGSMASSGEPETVRDDGTSLFVEGHRLPGGWLLSEMIGQLVERSANHGVVTASIANCFHIGCLQVYLQAATEQGLMCFLTTTDPTFYSLAPHGGADAVTTSNPIACGIPTESDPILIDMTSTVVSNAAIKNHSTAGTPFPGQWVKDNQGNFSNDPDVMSASPPGTIAPLGGEDFGYKGYALSMMVEAFSLALSGYSRTEKHGTFSEGVFVQLINPDFFAGRDIFQREMQDLSDRTVNSRAADGQGPVKYPGQRAMQSYRKSETEGISVSDEVQTLTRLGV
jgi:LDH2 family malate/lactate/ureidoglycolate dehydrogenase